MSTFRKQYLSFLESLKGTYPEFKAQIRDEKIRVNDVSMDMLILNFMKELRPVMDKLRARDINALRESPCVVFKGVTISNLVSAEGISEKSIQAVLSHIQTLYLLGAHTFQYDLEGSDAQASFHEFLEEFSNVTDEEMEESLRDHSKELLAMFHNLSKHMEENDAENAERLGDAIPGLKGLLDGKIGELAKSIASEIKPEEFGLGSLEELKSPQDVFDKILKKPQKLMSVVKKVGSKVQDKIKSGEINQHELMAEATKMMESMEGSEMFSSMMKKVNPSVMRKMKTMDRMRKKQKARQGGGEQDVVIEEMDDVQPSIDEIMKFIGGEEEEQDKPKKSRKKKKKNNAKV